MQSTMKGYATNFADPAAAWYSNALQGQHDALTLLKSSYPLPSATVAAAGPGTPSAVFPSIGWAAMHSNLRDMNRTSVYFKSSPYGSYNHSHGDQNTFVLFKGGIPLLGEGGYYDYYGSPLWKGYYRSTRSHNGITFDGGIGQTTDVDNSAQLENDGKITAYSHTPDMDYVEGIATKAYGGALTNAQRKLWYLRAEDAVVVHDTLASATSRTYEWNVHAFAPITDLSSGALQVTSQGQTVCIRPVTSGYHVVRPTNTPQLSGRTEYHAVLTKTGKAMTGEFLVVLDVGCKNPAISLTTTSSGRVLKVGAQSLVLPGR